MSDFELRSTFDATSASGAMLMRHAREPILIVGLMLAGLETSTGYAHSPELALHSQRTDQQTTAGISISETVASGAAINELRRLSGLTWDQLALLFNVSRRSLHFWSSGKPMAPGNERHLQRLLAVVRKIDRGSASANRSMLLAERDDGGSALDLLVEGEYEHVLSLLGLGDARRPSPPRLSDEVREARSSRPPEELVGALQDPIHRNSGVARAAKSVRVRGGR